MRVRDYDELSDLAKRLEPFEIAEEHGGYALDGHDETDETLIAAALEHDLWMVGERLRGGYTVERVYGVWEHHDDGDPEAMRLRSQDEPGEGLEPMTFVNHDWTLGGSS